ncbi:type I polyketide synthase [Sandaracinus amylolyticus]|uniref:type I polyketide synthase n=1 Tax=Sandaracinus amylolyticus TaxID=927083 RepID=UPI001F1DECF8|nr:type I polyketide synthase [Sandaracinus amylolyticus]UJR80236.1 Phthiocerol synthesis polyketide synthase type I PpsE [Sandaracinus amylolyticus]
MSDQTSIEDQNVDDEGEVDGNAIAIVGMATRVPGARSVDEYWRNLKNGVESVRRYTDEELLAAGESPENLRKKNYVRAGAPLDDMEMFDGEFFGFSPKESAIMDPQHRQFLEAAWEAMENAGHPPEKFDGPVGVWSGCGPGFYFAFNLCTNPELTRDVGLFLLRHTGNDKDFLPTRVSYLLNLHGPSMAVQTACSSSLTAVHLAVQSLLAREVDMALAGGVTVEMPHRRGYLYHEGEVLSPDGHCHAFDHRAQGTVFGSGTGIVVLRRLDDALADGDHIYAIIKGTAVNNDGSTKVNYLAPSVDGQARCMVEAYGLSGVSPDTIDYIETHGTGTYLGDPIEIAALTQAFRKETKRVGYCRIGSVKSNIGHLDNAAGVASLIKASLALYHRQMPPSLNYEKPNPTIDFATSPFVVNDRLTEWKRGDHPRRAAVNSLGVGGTNAHAVLEEAPEPKASSDAKRPWQLLTVSGRNNAALDDNAKRLAAYLEANPQTKLADIAWTLHVGRREFDKRRVVVARDHAEAAKLLRESDPRRVFGDTKADKPSIVFLLPGGGAQYARMGADLYDAEPVFKQHVDRGLDLLKSKHGIDLRPLLFCKPDELEGANAELEAMPHQLPAIFIVEYALAQLWKSWGVEPAALLGHSLGENTAACLAGVMSFEDCLGLVALRGKLFAKVPGGAMTSVALRREDLEPIVGGAVDIAVINVPDVTVVSGPLPAIEALEAQLTEREIEHKRLAIPVAAHSRMLEPILGEFRAYLKSIKLSKPKTPFLSNRTGTWITDAQAIDPEYWVGHLRGSVDFSKCLATLFETKDRVVIEVGPGRTLSSLAKQHPSGGAQTHALVSLRHKDEVVDDAAYFLTQLGRVWAAGGTFDWDRLWAGETRKRVPLPTYAFQRQYFFIQPGKVQVLEEDVRDLPKLEDVSEWGWRPVWRPSLVQPPESTKPQTWLVFMDSAGLGKRLRERLASHGHNVISVWEGDAYVRRSDTEYAIAPERGREGYVALLQDLIKSGHAPSRIAHLWMVTADESFRPGSSFFHRNQERGFYSLLFLGQAMQEEALATPIHITMVGNGLAQVEHEALPYPEKSTLLGPVKVIPREMPGVTCSAIDLRLPETSSKLFGGNLFNALIDPFAGRKAAQEELEDLAKKLEAEVLAPARNAVVALRGAVRFEEALEQQKLPTIERTLHGRVKDGAVVMITGGLGGLGLLFAEHLASSRRAKLILVGRTELPEREQWDAHLRAFGPDDKTSQRIQKVRALERIGAEVMVAAADVTIESEMRDVVRRAEQKFGRIDGVLHTAGVVRDALISQKTQGECEDVFTPKIHGTLVLDRVLSGKPLDFFVLFSSTSSLIGAAGQVDYVAANAFLNAFAQSRRERGLPATAIAWGIWNDVGMAHEAMTSKSRGSSIEIVGEAGQPMLDAVAREGGAGRRETLIARWHHATCWFLDEHRTAAGHALIPGTGYLELAREALAALGAAPTGGTSAFEIQDLFFIRPLAVGEDEAKEVRVRLEPTQAGYAMEVRSRIELDGKVGWELHAQASLSLAKLGEPRKVPVESIEARCDLRRQADIAGIKTPQEQFLRFGPRWRVLHEVRWGRGEAIADLALDPRFEGEVSEYGLHPALLDLATGYAMDLIPGYDAKTLWVPLSYESVKVHAPLTSRIRSWVRYTGEAKPGVDLASFDVVLCDPAGNTLVEVKGFSIKRTAGTGEFALAARPSPSEVELEKGADRELSPAEQQLARNLERGILPHEGADAFERVMEGLSQPRVVVSSMNLEKLVKQADLAATETKAESGGTKFARPNLDNEYVEARDDIERTLVGYFQDLLGVEMVGVRDSFFDLGGHSLIAVRLFAKIKKTFSVDFPISVLFEAPSIERISDRIRERVAPSTPEASTTTPGGVAAPREEKPKTRYTHLVAMHPGGRDEDKTKTPFFIVAGMFGNVLNLRHLAHLIGTDRRFYGLQALGLYGDSKPHETFEEMAHAYLTEMRTVQPHGPYMIGGFSGGGITAYEMAHQLRKAGEEVSLLLLLDTPLPLRAPLSAKDRAAIKLVELKQKGPAYVAEWAQRRLEWEASKLRKRFEEPEGDTRSDEFRSELIGQAFRDALPRYVMRQYTGKVTLFRPAPQPQWVLGEGVLIDKDRHYILADNGWTPWVSQLEIHEVPGDHDSMVLEPNVRVLARRLRKCIEAVERTPRLTSGRANGETHRDDASGTRPSPARIAMREALEETSIADAAAGAEE